MSDAFDALRLPDLAVDPDPAFAARLRARVERGLQHNRRTASAGGTMAEPDTGRLHTITPYIAVGDAPAAIRWYVDVLGARQLGEPWIDDHGKIGHAEFAIGDSTVMISDEHPELDVLGPRSRGGTTVTLHVGVDDADDVVQRAVAAGAELERPVADQGYGRLGIVRDPWGHRWMVNATRRVTDEPAPQMPAQSAEPESRLGYFVVNTPDDVRARDFYAGVLGWEFATGTVPRGFHITNVAPMGGLAGGEEGGFTPWFQVPDIDQAVRRVRELGGTAADPEQRPYGRETTCTDDQGLRFGLLG